MGPDVKLNANVLTDVVPVALVHSAAMMARGFRRIWNGGARGSLTGSALDASVLLVAAAFGSVTCCTVTVAFGSVTCCTVTVASRSRPTSLVGVSKHDWHKLKHGVTDITRKMIFERWVWQAEQILCGEAAAVAHARSSAKLGRCGE
jgi:hypothetical protein